MKINNEFKDLIPPLAGDELKQLENNLLKEGWRKNERIITWNDTIVDGHNRYSLCKKNNIEFKSEKKKFKDKNEAILWMIDNQLGRRNIPDYARGELNIRKENILKPLAKENLRIATGGRDSKTLPKLAKSIDVREKLSKASGVSHGTFDKIKYIKDNAPEEVKQKLRSGNKELSINKVYTILKRKEKEEKREEERKEDAKKVEKIKDPKEIFKEIKFTTVVIDPPWDWSDEGDVNQLGRAKPNYNTLSFEEIKKLPINELTKENSHIYLWITNRSLPKGFELLKEWGFRYITCLTWCKPSIGMGNYYRGSSEQILFGVKGSLGLKRKDVGTWFLAKRPSKKHSSKPDEFYNMVEKCSPGLYLDYFGRKERNGWIVYGNKIKDGDKDEKNY